MASQEDEKAIDGLLRRSLARGSAAADCPDAEVIAAYFDKSLGADEAARYELHFSTCSRCREQLAMMARASADEPVIELTELLVAPVLASARPIDGIAKAAATWGKTPATKKVPAVSVITTKPQRAPSKWIDLRWLVPVAAVLLVGTFTFLRFASRGINAPVSEVALSKSTPSPQNEVAPASQPEATTQEFAAPEKSRKKANLSPSNQPSHPPSRSSASRPAPAGNPAATGSGATRSGSAGNVTSRSMRAAPGRPTASGGSYMTRSPGAIIQERPRASAEAAQAAETKAAPAAPATELNAPQSKVAVTTASADAVKSPAPPPPAEAEQKSETTEITTAHGLRGGAAVSSLGVVKAKVRPPAPIVIRTPDPSVMYRLTAGGLVETSEDGGANWQGQRLDPPADFLAGSAPEPDVCWLVGRAGVIFLTDDGKSWKKIPSPVSNDLVAVGAQSASAASITTKDGQKWSTDDGGKTWHTEE